MSVDKISEVGRSPLFDPRERSQSFWAQKEDHHLHAGFLNISQQIQEYNRSEFIRSISHSGIMTVGDREIKDRSDSLFLPGDTVTGNSLNDRNTFYIYAPDKQYKAIVNGWVITLYNILGNGALDTSRPNPDHIAIRLPDPLSSGNRFDFIFLEVWREEIDSEDTIHPIGNVDTASGDITNDISESREPEGEVNAIVEIRSKIRVISGIDYETHPLGFSDTSSIFARGPKSSDTTRTFSHRADFGDSGLWIAGNDTDPSRDDLGTTDGYSYAIPIAVVFRRNTATWNDASNPNGNSSAITDSTSDRPDGLRNDQILPSDVFDTRSKTTIGPVGNFASIARKYRDKTMRNSLRLGLRRDDQVVNSDVWGNEILYKDTLEDIDGAFNSARRRWSNERGSQRCVASLTNGTSNSSDIGGMVTLNGSSKAISIDASVVRSDATVGSRTPIIKWTSSSGTTTTIISGTWSGLGTGSAEATIDVSGAGYSPNGRLFVDFDIDIPSTVALTKIPTDVVRAEINSSPMYVGEREEDLTLANMTSNGQYGIAVDRRTRGVVEIARRESISSGSGSTVFSSGRVLATSSGNIDGNVVTGLSANTNISVIYSAYPVLFDSIEIWYKYSPVLSPSIPTTMDIEMLYMEDMIFSSNLGTGGGNRGVPYLNPLMHIADNSASGGDGVLSNSKDITIEEFGGNWGIVQLPVMFKTPWDVISQLSDPAIDSEGRPFYRDASEDYISMAQPLSASQWHRSFRFGLARCKQSNGEFLKELVLICFSDTNNGKENRAGVWVGVDSTMSASIFRIKELIKSE